MDKDLVQRKMTALLKLCECGSGKMVGMCCNKSEAQEIANELCPCGSGNVVKNCCMRDPESHA